MNPEHPNAPIDYTKMENHQETPDSQATGDPSRPQGTFWDLNERLGARAIEDVDLADLEVHGSQAKRARTS